ncbi:MAG: glycoside hydrolase family 2 protein [Clostridiales bacterium]|nr:glycoside hydrolase family 2 protein [Clostridiales bacterium]
MLLETLNGTWKMREVDEIQWQPAVIPGSVMSTLLANGLTSDPYWRDNEYAARELFRKDYEFQREFYVEDELYSKERIELLCYGLDTIAEIYINEKLLACTNNMHRTWRLECKSLLNHGDNTIRIVFRSPIEYIEKYKAEEGKEIDFAATGVISGNQYIRKAHSMFGWDWGAQIPDAGIWRDIELVGFSDARISDVEIIQHHEDGKVRLELVTKLEIIHDDKYILEYELVTPDGNKISNDTKVNSRVTNYTIEIPHPELWWPNGLGKQPLYELTVNLVKSGCIDDTKAYTIGLRTLTISQEKDQWGSEFAFMVNGVKIFAKGADYIPEDTIYSHITKDRIKYLIDSSVRANYNCLRIWGGGYYPSDDFFDLCDSAGIIVWQDLMYACNLYDFNKEFEENIIEETKDNVRRIRHHASLGLWCGNNEMETAWVNWGGFKDHAGKLKADYIKQFEYVLPKVVENEDRQNFYWPSSPSSGGSFDNPDDENRGDVHYWAVWHGLKPFEDYRNYYFRFCSEFGFQSFPSIKTVNSFTEKGDRNIFSKVMESHQKNEAANGKILYYLAQNFSYPNEFGDLLYVSQILQGIAIKYGVEHWRRHRGRCMGSLYWQLNDNWPVASWASIDYYGRWKALHYMAKNFYESIAGSLKREDSIIEAHIQNETLYPSKCDLVVNLKKMDFTLIDSTSYSVTVPALSVVKVMEKDFASIIKGYESTLFVEAIFTDESGHKSYETNFFEPYKHLELELPNISFEVEEEEDTYIISLKSDKLACFVELDFADSDAIFSDNYFFLTGTEGREIKLLKEDITGEVIKNGEDLANKLLVRSLRDTYE